MGRGEERRIRTTRLRRDLLTLRRRASCTISGRIRHELGRALSADNAMTTTFSHDAFAPDSRPSGPRPYFGAAGSTSLLVTIATRHPPCQRFRRKSPNAGLTWFEDCRSLGAEFARPGKTFLLFWR